MTPNIDLQPQQHLFIADDFALPLDILVEKSAILGRSGSGKTNTSTLLVEELLSAKQQVVILDPPGAWWGLRSSADGQSEGFPIAIFGGEHGDLPLDSHQGATIAGVIVDTRLSAVLDLSDFSLGEIARFGRDFAKQLYERKARHRDPMLLVVEEADELIPQQPQPNQTECLGAFERIAKRGRMRGIGGLRICQRSASLNKNDLSQVALLIAMQTTDPRDRDAIDNWIKLNCSKDQRDDLLLELARLPQGTGFAIWPQRGIFQRLSFRRRHTFDSSATPQPGQTPTEPATLATIDLDAIRQLLEPEENAPEAEPQNNANQTHQEKRIRELESQLATITLDRASLTQRVHTLDDLLRQLLQRAQAATTQATDLRNLLHGHIVDGQHLTLAKLNLHLVEPLTIPTTSANRKLKSYDSTAPSETLNPEQPPNPGLNLNAGQRRIMETLALFPNESFNRTQLATLSGLSAKGGSYGTYLSNLQKLDLIAVEGNRYSFGPRGHEVIEPIKKPTTHEEVLHRWTTKLKGGPARMLQMLAAHPKGLTRQQLAGLMNMSASGGSFGQYIATLRQNSLIEVTKTHIKPSRYLWPEHQA